MPTPPLLGVYAANLALPVVMAAAAGLWPAAVLAVIPVAFAAAAARARARGADMSAISAGTSAASIFVAARDIAPPPRRAEWEAYLSQHGRSFWMAARLIPPLERAQLAGVYAWCRYTDDLVDHATCSWPALLGVLGEWEALSRAAYEGSDTGIELLDIVMGDMARCDVPFTYASNLIRGMRADAVGLRFDTHG